MNNHTFLFIPAVWSATGSYEGQDGTPVPVEGEARITHGGDIWYNFGFMRLNGPKPQEFSNDYEIVPFLEGATSTSWTSLNPALGVFEGTFTVAGSTIISHAETQDGSSTVSETFIRVSDDTYTCNGSLFTNDEKVAAWLVELKLVK